MVGRILGVALLLVLLTPATGAAISVRDIVALSRAGLADSIIVAVIDADGSVFNLTPEQIVELKDAGVPDAVLARMVGTTALSQATVDYDQPPPVVVIGEEPPPTATYLADVAPYFFSPYVVGLPYSVFPFTSVPMLRYENAAPLRLPMTYRGSFGQFINDGWTDGVPVGRFIDNRAVRPAPVRDSRPTPPVVNPMPPIIPASGLPPTWGIAQ